MDLLPGNLHDLRWELNQKAKKEPKFRFHALYDRVFRMDVLEAAWKHVGKQDKAAGIDGVRAEIPVKRSRFRIPVNRVLTVFNQAVKF